MRRRPTDAVLQGACSFAVAKLARNNHYHQNEIEMCGMTKLLHQAFVGHPDDEQIQNWSRVALALCRISVDSPERTVEAYKRSRCPQRTAVSLKELSKYLQTKKKNQHVIASNEGAAVLLDVTAPLHFIYVDFDNLLYVE